MKKKDYQLGYRMWQLESDFKSEGYMRVGTFVEGLGSSYRITRLKHANGNTIDIASSDRFYEIIVKKNGIIIKNEKL